MTAKVLIKSLLDRFRYLLTDDDGDVLPRSCCLIKNANEPLAPIINSVYTNNRKRPGRVGVLIPFPSDKVEILPEPGGEPPFYCRDRNGPIDIIRNQ